jgi:hypothetical protein
MDKEELDRNLRIYLNDHLAGSTGGLELARRARSNSTDPERTAMWNTICEEVESDREVLRDMLERLEYSQNPLKAAVAWVGEKAGRLKPNGQLTGPSPLGQYVELEMMLLGVTGKLALWRMLAQLDDPRLRDFDLNGLIERAESQRLRLDEHRLGLGASTFG